jgi:hypothetical protein
MMWGSIAAKRSVERILQNIREVYPSGAMEFRLILDRPKYPSWGVMRITFRLINS